MPQTDAANSIAPDLAERLRTMPKAEIHVHAEGKERRMQRRSTRWQSEIELSYPQIHWRTGNHFLNFAIFPISSRFMQQQFSAYKHQKTTH